MNKEVPFHILKMKLEDFDDILPKERIAQKPISPRDHSNLLVLNKDGYVRVTDLGVAR